MPFLGTLVNCGAVAGGGLLGIFLSKAFSKYSRLASIPNAAMKTISLLVIFIGIKGAMKTENETVILISLVAGTVIGTIIDIDGALEKLGLFLERKFVKNKPSATSPELDELREQKSISKGFVSTTLTCCVGALAIMGALNSGLTGGDDQQLLYTKSLLDFVTAIVFSSAFGGIGTMLAAIPILIYQGAIELGAGAISGVLLSSINEISATGSIIVMGLGLNMVGATKIKIANMLPSIFLPILFCQFM